MFKHQPDQPEPIQRQETLSHFAGYDFDLTLTRDEANKIMSSSGSGHVGDFLVRSQATNTDAEAYTLEVWMKPSTVLRSHAGATVTADTAPRKFKRSINMTEAVEVADCPGVTESKYYIHPNRNLKFGSLDLLYQYHSKKPLIHNEGGIKYEACLVNPMHSTTPKSRPQSMCLDRGPGMLAALAGGRATASTSGRGGRGRGGRGGGRSGSRLPAVSGAAQAPMPAQPTTTVVEDDGGRGRGGDRRGRTVRALYKFDGTEATDLALLPGDLIDEAKEVEGYVQEVQGAAPATAPPPPPRAGGRGGHSGGRSGSRLPAVSDAAQAPTMPAQPTTTPVADDDADELGGFGGLNLDDGDDLHDATTDSIDLGHTPGSTTTGNDSDDSAEGFGGFGDAIPNTDFADYSSPVKEVRVESQYFPHNEGADDLNDVYAVPIADADATFNVTYHGTAALPEHTAGPLSLAVVTGHGVARIVLSSEAQPEIKTFLTQVLHTVQFDGATMSFVHIEHSKRLAYKFAFESDAMMQSFTMQLPEELQGRYLVVAGAGSGAGDARQTQARKTNSEVYDGVRDLAAQATGDASHRRQNRSEQHLLGSETRYYSDMVVKRLQTTTGDWFNLGRHYGRLKMSASDNRPAFFFEFVKLLKKGSSAEAIKAFDDDAWERLVICPFANAGATRSEITDHADDYMFEISGFGSNMRYQIWPQIPKAGHETLRPPLREKCNWLKSLKEACAEMDADRVGRDRVQSRVNADQDVAFEKQYLGYKLFVKKGKETDIIDREFEEFQGTIELAIYAKKKSPSAFKSHDERLVELLVERNGEQSYAIIRYRNDDKTDVINGFIDLGADGEKGESDWKASVESLVPSKGNLPPTPTTINEEIPRGKKGHVIHGAEGKLTLVMKDRRRAGEARSYEFKLPGTKAGCDFYNRVMAYARDWKVKKLRSKKDGIAGVRAAMGGSVARSGSIVESDLEIALRDDDLGGAQFIIDRLATSEESDLERFIPISQRGGGQALRACFPKMEWSILHRSMDPLYLERLIAITKTYLQAQIDLLKGESGLGVVAKLEAVVKRLDSSSGAYRTAFENVKLEPGFAKLMVLLGKLGTSVAARCALVCGSPKPKQSTAKLKTIYENGRAVSAQFDKLVDELEKWCKQEPVVADAKDPFRALEKVGLDPNRLSVGWNFSSITDIVRGGVTVDNTGQAHQVMEVLMACDDHQQDLSSLRGQMGSTRKAIGGRGITIVGVKNRFAEASVAGEWRDIQIKFFFDTDKSKHVCEIQIMHTFMFNVRERAGLHDVYDKARNAMELLAATGR